LSSLVLTAAVHSSAAGQTFLASDGEDISTTELVRKLARALNCRARLIPIPVAILRSLGKLSGRGSLMQQLCGSLQVDITKTRSLLGWKPPLSLDDGLHRLAPNPL